MKGKVDLGAEFLRIGTLFFTHHWCILTQ